MIDSHEKTKVRERTNFRESPFFVFYAADI